MLRVDGDRGGDLLGSAPAVSAQSTRDLGIGKVLVAKQDTRESTFAETAILIVRYSRGGTVGLMLNRRSEVPISRALEPLKGAGGRSDPVFAGGPVEMADVLALLRADVMPESAEHVTGKVYLVPTGELLEKILAKRPDPADFRVYLGYAGWSPGQLENEVSHGFWRVMNASADIVFDSEPGESIGPVSVSASNSGSRGRLDADRQDAGCVAARPLSDARSGCSLRS